ncbi:MAG: 2TM domain-containing protein [Saprospiraceae bacterium]|nr:2TM domain-containing protein [Saprospiraceae bacterium]
MDKETVAFLKAEKRVKELKSFYRFLFIWIIISCFLMAMNLATGDREFWSIFPVMGMGLGVMIKYVRVFGWPGFGKDWEERKFYEELERIKEREERIKYMLNKGKNQTPASPASPADQAALDLDKLDLKEVRKQWRDSELV